MDARKPQREGSQSHVSHNGHDHMVSVIASSAQSAGMQPQDGASTKNVLAVPKASPPLLYSK